MANNTWMFCIYFSYGAMNQTFAGAIGFCAPEVMAEEPYSSKCDMFSLGCVLYNILMLRPPVSLCFIYHVT